MILNFMKCTATFYFRFNYPWQVDLHFLIFKMTSQFCLNYSIYCFNEFETFKLCLKCESPLNSVSTGSLVHVSILSPYANCIITIALSELVGNLAYSCLKTMIA